MKKIFILTGEPSGDKLASTVIKNLKNKNSEIEYLSVGGSNLKKLGINSIFDLKEITYLGFTNVILNIFKIRKKINQTGLNAGGKSEGSGGERPSNSGIYYSYIRDLDGNKICAFTNNKT